MDPRLQHGLRLYQAGEFFEAHEVWEGLWLETPRRDRFFVQGLIHCAVARYHQAQGNPEGALRQIRKALAKLAGYLPAYQGIDTRAFIAEALLLRDELTPRAR